MLGKLIKYDFKATSRSMFPLFLALISLTTICSIMTRFRLTAGFFFTALVIILGILLSISFFVTLYCTVSRFVNGLLKNEGYLSFALPVNTATHIAAKVINTIIWASLEMLCVCVCILIMGFIAGSVEEIRELCKMFFSMDSDFYLVLVQALILMSLELIAATCMFFAAFAVAHLLGKHQILFATIFVIVAMVIRMFFFPTKVFISSYSDALIFDWQWFLKPLLFAAIFSALTWYILDRRLNLE
ncbi:MAG: hypothetical protein IJI46_02300 [Erysipelotrichaceae bacterium]|nr:hypothetical protein [Erysipelotrichaceae bacterium]